MNLDALEQENGAGYNTPSTPSYQPSYQQNNYGNSYGTNYGTSYGDNYNSNMQEPPLWAEFAFQGILLLLAFLVPLSIYAIKKSLKSIGWLTPVVVRILDRIQSVFHKTVSKVFKKKINKNISNGGKVSAHDVTDIVVDEITGELKTKLYVAPDENKENEEPTTPVNNTVVDDVKVP